MKSSLFLLIFGNTNQPVVDLRKKPTRADTIKELNFFFQRNFYLFSALAILFCLLVFLAVCFSIVGTSATESGMLRNFINGGYV